MTECDGFFDQNNIPFEAGFEDLAVHIAWRLWYSDPHYAKFLIQCWFDTTYRGQRPVEEQRPLARTKMSEYLKTTPFRSYEELLEAQEDWRHADNQGNI